MQDEPRKRSQLPGYSHSLRAGTFSVSNMRTIPLEPNVTEPAPEGAYMTGAGNPQH